MMTHIHTPSMAIPLTLVGLVTICYFGLALREQIYRRGWSKWRTLSFSCGAAVLALGLLPDWLPFPTGDFRKHMLEHLAIGMVAPIGLVMGAPVTLVLRASGSQLRAKVMRIIRSRPVLIAATPVVALILNLGGMVVLYFTPLYRWMMEYPFLHYLIHFHFLTAGYLYCWVIAGPDPAPKRPTVETRLVVLGVAIVIHSVLAQLLYAGIGVEVFSGELSQEMRRQLQQGAELMYYGGDLSEMILAFALVTTWKPARKVQVAGPHIAQTAGL